jgi:hypothetical protein
VEDLNGSNDLIESNAYFMLASWRAILCSFLLPKNLSQGNDSIGNFNR